MVAISAEKRMQYKLFFHVIKLLLVLFIAILFPVRRNIEGNQSPVLLSVHFAMPKIIFRAAFTA